VLIFHVVFAAYRLVREWLLPPWLLTIQIFLILALVVALLARALSAVILLREPLAIILR
jgi:hypothetical protein